jgi:hypothetical protein
MAEEEPDWLPGWVLKTFYVVAGIIVFADVSVAVLIAIVGYRANPPPSYVVVHTHGFRRIPIFDYDRFVAPWIANLDDITSTLMVILGALIVIFGIVYAVISVLRRAQP